MNWIYQTLDKQYRIKLQNDPIVEEMKNNKHLWS